MGMDLVPVYADRAGDLPPGTVRIDPGFVQSVGVRSEPVARQSIAQTIRTVGTLAHNDRQIAWVNTKYDGWIENVAVNYLGETVEEGQVLFDIYSPRLVTTQMEYLQAVDYAARLETSAYPAIAERARSLVASARARLGYGTSPTSRSRPWSASARRAAPCRSCPRSPASSSRRWTRRSTVCTSRRA